MEPTTTIVLPGPGQLVLAAVIIGAGVTAGALIVNVASGKLQEHLASKQLEEEIRKLQQAAEAATS